MNNKLVVQSVNKRADSSELHAVIEQVLLRCTNNLSWLKSGDKVLLKPALNSPDPYPATTSPDSIKVVHDILVARGAKVIVADQSGIEHVQHSPAKVMGSSKNNFMRSGMGKNLQSDFVALETRGWDAGFNKFTNNKTKSWTDGYYVTSLVKEVDHIINLPRLSTHSQAGVTLGFKNLVGLLRQDSRMEFHADGPFFQAIKINSKGTSDFSRLKNNNQFFPKIVEISESVRDKLRLTLFVGTKAQITFGPDKKVMGISSKVVAPDTGLVFASANQLSAEAFAIKYLKYLYEQHAGGAKTMQKMLVALNSQITELNKQAVWDNSFLIHALKLKYGTKDFTIESLNDDRIIDKIKSTS